MGEGDAPGGRPHYMDRCEGMGPADLGKFIERALRRLRGPASLDPESLPTTEEEFAVLCGLLASQVEAMKQKSPTPVPPRPTYGGPPNPGTYWPSDELEEWGYRRDERLERLEDAIRHREGENYVQHLRRDLRAAERRISALRETEGERRREHENRRGEYLEAWAVHKRRLRLWEAQESRERKRLQAEAARDRMVRRIRRGVEEFFAPQEPSGPRRDRDRIGALPFELAAPGEGTSDRAVYGYFREVVGRGRLAGFDQERLDKLLALPRSNWRRGTGGKYGYVVLMFAHTEKVLLECPIRDNAIYVLDSGERRLLEMDKQGLIASDEVKRIFHTGDWYGRVKRELEIADPSPNAA